MASQALEQMLENTFAPAIGQDRMYQTIDTYAAGTTALYSGKLLDPKFNPIGSQGSGFQTGSTNNIYMEYDLGEMTQDPELSGWRLQERFDFSGHDGTNHINYGWRAPDDLIKERREEGLPNYKDLLKINLDL